MASDKNNNKKHKCSCGRAFRHAISLKRHQKVAGCQAAEEVVEVAPVAEVAEVTQEQAIQAEVTAKQVAAWQRQRGFIAPEPPKQPLIDWEAVRRTGEDFVDFLHESKKTTTGFLTGLVHFGARLGVFGMVVAGMGWFLLSGSLMATPAAAQNAQHDELAAQTVVENFLQTAQLGQYDRARGFLAPTAQQSVSADQLEAMFAGLPLSQTPDSWSAQADGHKATVTVHRAGQNEVYTLVENAQGWGLCSVSVSRS